jgi:hypothetical protein
MLNALHDTQAANAAIALACDVLLQPFNDGRGAAGLR